MFIYESVQNVYISINFQHIESFCKVSPIVLKRSCKYCFINGLVFWIVHNLCVYACNKK